MPEINFNFHIEDNLNGYEKIHEILNKFFDDNHLYRTFKLVIFDMYKKRIQYYSKKEIFTEEYISKLDKSIKFIITNTISGFDSHIFAKQLQESGYKIINVMHVV